MTTNKYLCIVAITATTFLINSCNKSEKTDNIDKTEELVNNEPNTYDSISDKTLVSENQTLNSSDHKDIDKMLDDYEEYVDKYIDYSKKLQKSDMTAMKDAAEIMEKAEDYGNSMEKIKDEEELTAKQVKRMMEIQTRMLSAVSAVN